MATYTTNMGLKKPDGSENMNVADINGNTDDIDAAITNDRKAIAIVSKGNTHAAVTSGQYVYVYNHGTLPDGLYKATANVSANGTLSTSNLSSVSSGGFNDVVTSLSAKVNTTDRVIIDRNRNDSLADCNEITTPGMYRLISSTANRPDAISYGTLLHLMSNDYIAQFLINTAGTIMMYRGKASGSWTSWKEVQNNSGDGDLSSGETKTLTMQRNRCMVHLSRINQSKSVLLGFDYWSANYSVLGGSIDNSNLTITKSASSSTITIKNNNNYVVGYKVL